MKSERELKEYAQKVARNITIRTYNKYGSEDTTRQSTLQEKKIIKNVVYGALLTIRGGGDTQTAADTAEFIGMKFLPEANCYDTFYLPIKGYKF